jgi:outer membrane protein
MLTLKKGLCITAVLAASVSPASAQDTAMPAAAEMEQAEKGVAVSEPVLPIPQEPVLNTVPEEVKAKPEVKPDIVSMKTVDQIKSETSKSIKELFPVEKDQSNSQFFRALATAYDTNPTLKAARAELHSVFEALPQAESGWRPVVAAGADVTSSHVETNPGSSMSGTSKEASLSLVQPLYRGGQTIANTNKAKNSIRAQLAAVDATEQGILLQVATSYMNLLRDEALVRLSENNRKVIAKQSEATNERFKVGELTRTDVSQAEARLAGAEAEVTVAKANLSTSRAIFEQMTGYRPEGDLSFPVVALDMPVSLDDAVALAEKWNPSVRAALHAHNAAQDDISSKFGQLLPEISVQGGVAKSYDPISGLYDDQDSASVAVVATVPLYEAGAVRSQIRGAKHVASQRQAQIAEATRAAREQVISSWESLKAAEAEIKSREAQVEAAEVARFGVKEEANLGARTILDTLDADQEVRDAQASLITARRNEVVARFALASALGILTPKTLGFSEKVPDYDREIEAVRHNYFGTDVDSLGN